MDGTLTPNSWATSFTNDNVGFFFVSFLSQLRMTMLTIPSCRDGWEIVNYIQLQQRGRKDYPHPCADGRWDAPSDP